MKNIVAVSGGPDSMALLHHLEAENKDYLVCHVNYKHRPTADRDEEIVRKWCKEHKKEIRVYYPHYTKGNFEAWARDERYTFFEKTAEEVNAEVLYIGHHQGDLIETWMLQKQRGSIPTHYGLSYSTKRNNLTVLRPLLDKTKEELEQICKDNKIEYGIDETNLSDDYARNRIRHTLIQPSTVEQRKEWLQGIKEDNEKLKNSREKANQLLKMHSAKVLLNDKDCITALDILVYSQQKQHKTYRSLQDMQKKLKHTGKAETIQIVNDWFVFQEEDWQPIVIRNKEELTEYTKKKLKAGYFSLSDTGKEVEAFYVSPSDYPITIRSATKEDKVTMRFGSKTVLRALRDRKIPAVNRNKYPVIVNKNNEVLFVSLLGCSVQNYKKGEKSFVICLQK